MLEVCYYYCIMTFTQDLCFKWMLFFETYYSSKNPEKTSTSIIIILSALWAPSQHIRMISEGSCEKWSFDVTGILVHLQNVFCMRWFVIRAVCLCVVYLSGTLMLVMRKFTLEHRLTTCWWRQILSALPIWQVFSVKRAQQSSVNTDVSSSSYLKGLGFTCWLFYCS